MRTTSLLLSLITLINVCGFSQAPQVPHKLQFAGMTLTIRDDARREIQKDVDALTMSPKHFAIKVERAKTYFPIIEKIFEEENVPADFKFLVLQESALIADAVSPSNAVGFWQFKDYTAIEMGLRVDRQVDERMNIASSSRGAARYFKKNNFFFNNWLYALQAYQMGAGAVMKSVTDSQAGATHMEVTSNTYWYVKKYLAHKIAFEDALTGPAQFQVSTYVTSSRKAMAEIASEQQIDEVSLRSYNKWVKTDFVPDDKAYVVLIPKPAPEGGDIALAYNKVPLLVKPVNASIPVNKVSASHARINGLTAITAQAGEGASQIAARAGVDLSDFLAWNDMSISDPVKKGQHFFIRKKRARAEQAYHKVVPGEDLWAISQMYGVQLKKLRRYNRMEGNTVVPGETLWLTARRPKDYQRTMSSVEEAFVVDQSETFNWVANPQASTDKIEKQPDQITAPPEIKVSKRDTAVLAEAQIQSADTLMHQVDSMTQISKSVAALPAKDSVISITVRPTQHIVQPHETLYGIAKQYNVGVMDLVNWNNLDLQAGIKPGQALKLVDNQVIEKEEPKIDSASARGEIIHEVKASETLYSVARKYGVTIKDLMDWNGKKDFSVSVGDKLRIVKP